MAKKRNKKYKGQSNQSVKIHRYDAEVEEKKAAKKKFKIRLIALTILSLIIFLILWLIF